MERSITILAVAFALAAGVALGAIGAAPVRAAPSPVIIACMEANGTTYSPAAATRRLVTVLATQCTYALSKDKFGTTPFTAFYQ